MPSAARLAYRIVKARSLGRPHTLSHLVTSRCNARCATCLWRDATDTELDVGAALWLYEEASRMGIAHLVVWGGEPLLRQDLPELLAAARRGGLYTTLISNGWLLGDRWSEVGDAVDALIISLDDVGAAHDRLRALPGLFDRLDRFVLSLPTGSRRPKLMVNMVLSRQNRGALSRVAAVARRWHAGLYLCPMETGEMIGGAFVPSHAHLALSRDDLSAAAREALELRTRGYPILATRAYLELLARDPDMTGYRCRFPNSVLTVAADGAIRDCRRHDQALASVTSLRESATPLSAVLGFARRRDLLEEAAFCTSCSNPDVVELSWLWDLRPAMVAKVAELALR
jgi:MoaA/NifB/PqqE/SkfB family radical SAM enzyme